MLIEDITAVVIGKARTVYVEISYFIKSLNLKSTGCILQVHWNWKADFRIKFWREHLIDLFLNLELCSIRLSLYVTSHSIWAIKVTDVWVILVHESIDYIHYFLSDSLYEIVVCLSRNINILGHVYNLI